MRRILFVLIVSIMLIGLIFSACAAPAPSPAPKTAPTPTPAPAPVKTVDFKFSYHMPAPSSPGQAFAAWSKKVEEAGKGQIKITHYAGQTLAKQNENYDAVTSGLADIGLISTGAFAGRFPLSELMQLPMLFPNAKVGAQVCNEVLEKYTANREFKDVKVLWVFPMPPHGIVNRQPIEKMEDMKGQKIRVEGKYENMMVEGLGGSGVYLSPMDLYSSLERGVIDGVIFQWDGVLQYGLEKVTKNRAECLILTRGMPIVMNKDKWNSLSPDMQKMFEDTSGVKYSTQAGVAADELNITRRKQLADYDKQAGNPGIYTLPEAEMARWKAVAKTVQDKWAADCDGLGLPGKAMLQDAVSLAEKYSK
jgi:TRAP-type C4-dicarboxylate transport system substrate-binding protein